MFLAGRSLRPVPQLFPDYVVTVAERLVTSNETVIVRPSRKDPRQFADQIRLSLADVEIDDLSRLFQMPFHSFFTRCAEGLET
jgi:hypothetical protein